MPRLHRLTSAALALVGLTSGVRAQDGGFITRQGSTLMANGAPFRFVGGNMYWLGLDENVGGVHYPTKFRLVDGLFTAYDMGLTVVRGHTLGISSGSPLSFRPNCTVGYYNASALDAADYAIFVASQLGIRLIVPLTDNYKYYHGGKHDFSDCYGLPESAFYDDPRVIAAFQDYVRARLTHVNPYTGNAAVDEPAIMAWETGNELDSPSNWTSMMAAFIKSVDPHHLVLDGHYGIDPGTLPDQAVDVHSDHFYPINTDRLKAGVAQTQAAGKVYVAGEYAWTDLSATPPFLSLIQSTQGVSGSAFWSLFPHADTSGFVMHSDSFTLHFPGDTGDMRTMVQLVRNASAAIAGQAQPQAYGAPLQPAISGAYANGTVVWRGAAGADRYTVQLSTAGANGPWTTPCDLCATDWQVQSGGPLLVSPGGMPNPSWIRVQGYAPDNSTASAVSAVFEYKG